MRIEAAFEAEARMRGADISSKFARDVKSQAILSAIGLGFSGAGRAASLTPARATTPTTQPGPRLGSQPAGSSGTIPTLTGDF